MPRLLRRLSCFVFLLVLATSASAQTCPNVAGSYNGYEIFQIYSVIGGQASTNIGTNVFYAPPANFNVSQSSNTVVFFPGDSGAMTGGIWGNNITNVTGPAVWGSAIEGMTVKSNAIYQSVGIVYTNQLAVYVHGYFDGFNPGDSHEYTYDVKRWYYFNGTFQPLLAPQIINQPFSQTNLVGSSFTFSVAAAGASPLAYQWRNANGLISGATDSTFTVTNAQSTNAGVYVVRVSNIIGYTDSAAAKLVLNYPPSITVQPGPLLRVPLGTRGTLSVTAKGTGPLRYQWLLFGTNTIPGATNRAYTFSALPFDGGADLFYSVVVSNSFGSVQSANAHVVVTPDTKPPTVTITTPAAKARISTNWLSGAAGDNGQVAQVFYTITNLTDSSSIPPTEAALVGTNLSRLTWHAAPVINPGSNILAVYSLDLQGNTSAIASRPFFYKVASPFTLTVAGTGTGSIKGTSSVAAPHESAPIQGTTNLYIGQAYSLQAIPNLKNSFFTNWTIGSSIYTNLTSTFIMQPGLTVQANFVTNLFIGMAGSYNGLFANTDAAAVESLGALRNLVLKQNGAYSGQLLLAGAAYPISGTFDMSGHAQKTIARSTKAGGALLLDMNLDWNNTPRRVFGTVSTPGWSSSLTADLAVKTTNSGQFTAILPPATNSPLPSPGGYGYLTMSNNAGSFALSGALGDGATVSLAAPISADAHVPVYVSLYKTQGLLWGWLDLTSGSPAGNLWWIKKASPGLYPLGFTNSPTVIGSVWKTPAQKTAALPFTTNNPGVLEISGGDAGALSFNVAALANNTLVKTTKEPLNTLTGTVNPKTGVLKITFGVGKTTVTGSAAILQSQTNAFGAFPGRANSGSITLGQ